MPRVIDWRRVLDEHRVEYVTSGKNVKSGELGIRCPFCGTADPSHHMGLNLTTGYWSCWRNRAAHSGKSPLRLLMRLLGVSYGRAREIAGFGDDYVDPEGFSAFAARMLNRDHPDEPAKRQERFLSFDSTFTPITDALRTRRHWNYLYQRGFNMRQRGVEEVDLLVKQYNLMASTSSDWRDRIIIPFYLDDVLITWTGRAIANSSLRYRDLEVKHSLVPPKETLYNADCMAKGGRVLLLQEGPFDVLKVDFYGKRYGVRSVGLATNSMSESQSFILSDGVHAFDKTYVVMDTKNELGVVDSLRMRQQLAFIPNLQITNVPFRAGDGGALTGSQVIEWCHRL